ncbi:MAG: type VI secretion system baseplate subunit TssK [Francisellaceae bacterium]
MSDINWQLGQALLPEHLKFQQRALQHYAVNLTRSICGLKEGIIELIVDEDQLELGVLEIKRLSFILANGRFIDTEFNARVSKLRLTPGERLNGIAEIFINIDMAAVLEVETFEGQEIDVALNALTPVERFDSNARSLQFKLLELFYNEEDKRWQLTEFTPNLIKMPYLFGRLFYQRIRQSITRLESLMFKTKERGRFNQKYPLVAMVVNEIEYWLEGQNKHRYAETLSVIEMYLYRLLQVLSLLQLNLMPAISHAGTQLMTINHLLLAIDDLLNKKQKKKDVEPLLYQNGIYQSQVLADAFFMAEYCYLVVEANHSFEVNESLLKVFAPSQANEILTKALPGIDFHSVVNQPDIHLLFPDAIEIYGLDQQGQHWSDVMNDKRLCVQSAQIFPEDIRLYLSYV